MPDPLFLRPVPKARQIVPFANCNNPVLMPRKTPVLHLSLVKDQRPAGHDPRPVFGKDAAKWGVGGKGRMGSQPRARFARVAGGSRVKRRKGSLGQRRAEPNTAGLGKLVSTLACGHGARQPLAISATKAAWWVVTKA